MLCNVSHRSPTEIITLQQKIFMFSGTEMSEIQNKRARYLEKSYPGCLGRMVNMFDFGPGVTTLNKMLTEKAHRDGSPHPSSRLDPVKVLEPIVHVVDDKPLGHELRKSSSNNKSNGTPMKMLIAQEMSKETLTKRNPPSVVAKLMGLDALPDVQKNKPKHYSRFTQMQFESPVFHEQHDYKDVYEVWQGSPKTKDKSQQRGRNDENLNNRKMDLVRQKFLEAKRLSTDEKLHHSKEFQEALEVLDLNTDLFLKFLQEPNSLFRQQLFELQSTTPTPQANRITVLKASKINESNSLSETDNRWDKNKPRISPIFNKQKDDTSTQPTRIVVLKPGPGKIHDIKSVSSSPPFSPKLLHGKYYEEESEDDEARCSREAAKEITRQMRESFGSNHREETPLSSVFSNGYIGDESSFNRSENEFIGEGNLSDSDAMTPLSRHSWDYVQKYGSPFSSSFSRASYSPESSVCREAKKRLSERWAMMATNGNSQDQRQLRRSSSTLGEMLALPDTKKPANSTEEGIDQRFGSLSSRSCGGEQNLSDQRPCLSGSGDKVECGEASPSNLLRSRSVPISSTAYGARLNVQVPDPEVCKPSVPKELEKSKSVKSSFKGKVSSLFFSRNKKPSKEKSVEAPSILNTEVAKAPEKHSLGDLAVDISVRVTNSSVEIRPSQSAEASSSNASLLSPTSIVQKQDAVFHEVVTSVPKNEMLGCISVSQDQPSPVSVLEARYEDDSMTSLSSGNVKSDLQGALLNSHHLQSNLISKSPPIESLARSLSWDDTCSEIAVSPDPLNFSAVSFESDEWLPFIQNILSSSSTSSLALDHDKHLEPVFVRWHSPESPLDPALINKFVNQKYDKVQGNEAKRRQRRSHQKLIYDCVNAALVDMTAYKSSGAKERLCISGGGPVTVDEVWERVKEWLYSSEGKCFTDEIGDYNGYNGAAVVDSVVRKEVGGRRWGELMKFEVDEVGKEIQGSVLEELLEEAFLSLTG
ncbi:hypothetical protein GIB67_024583 [Kingdonia uniflora]|uniref:DUF4378 domain-containing protein n=1 Tax=Kingdonia uniflora TaxID=39325 RepID=A0A7J7LNW6_9MAGN|nr:hypothetical protein GIB67_024583 [Kingdonia uniflora]